MQQIAIKIQKKIIHSLARQYGVHIVWTGGRHPGAAFWRNENPDHIYISKKIKWGQSCIEMFFHELGHRYCYYHSKFPKYHLNYDGLISAKYCIDAEQWVDKWGERECAKVLGSNLKWKGSYRTKDDQKWLVKIMADRIRSK